MLDEHDRIGNNLLGVLPGEEWARMSAHLVLVDMPLGQVVYESGDRLDHVYFTNDMHRVAIVRDGGWRIGRDCDRGQ
jgi:hypothetical protein